jgi:hypothetical protein
LKPAEVKRELEATDDVLGDPESVREFVLSGAQRLGVAIVKDPRRDSYRVATGTAVAAVPDAIRETLPAGTTHWLVSFISPTPEGAEYLGRNHPFVSALARFLLEEALTEHGTARASRCGVLRTAAVSAPTTLLLMRLRHLIEQPQRAPLLAEQIVVSGLTRDRGTSSILPGDRAMGLLAEAAPVQNIDRADKEEAAAEALSDWPSMLDQLGTTVEGHAHELEASHKRIRQAVKMRVRELKVRPQLPPDLLGVLVLLPPASR